MNSWTSVTELCVQNHAAQRYRGVSHRCKMRETKISSFPSGKVESDKVRERQEDGWLHVTDLVRCHSAANSSEKQPNLLRKVRLVVSASLPPANGI